MSITKIKRIGQILLTSLLIGAMSYLTSKAMKEVDNGLIIVSSNRGGDGYLFGLDEEGVYHISRTVDIVKEWKKPYQFKSHETVLSELGKNDSVLMIHPQLHETKESQEYLINLIKKLKENPKIKFVTMYDFYQTVMPK